MFATYLTITLLAAVASGSAATADFAGAEFVKNQADRLRVPRSWMVPLGTLLAAGSLGLLAGVWVPMLGVLAASGLVLYFVGALGAHLRVRDYQLGPWAIFFALAVGALFVNAFGR